MVCARTDWTRRGDHFEAGGEVLIAKNLKILNFSKDFEDHLAPEESLGHLKINSTFKITSTIRKKVLCVKDKTLISIQ